MSCVGVGIPHVNTATVQQCGGQGLGGGENVNLVGDGVSQHEAGGPALSVLKVLEIAPVTGGENAAGDHPPGPI